MIIIYADGGSYNNQTSDRKAYGSFLVEGEKEQHRFTYGNHTNNEAEYMTLIKALEYIKNHREEKEFVIFTDSQLITKQIGGTWKCKNIKLNPLYNESKSLLDTLNNGNGKQVVLAWTDNKKMKKVLGH